MSALPPKADILHCNEERLSARAARFIHRLSTDQISRTLYSFLCSAAGLGSGETTARILHWFSAGESTVPGIPQTFSISVIAFTGKKFRSHWPSVTPSALVLVRFPLHVILSVEAAFPSAIVPKTSKRMHRTVMRVSIATTKAKRSLRSFVILPKRAVISPTTKYRLLWI
jgi:hypothetical protein